MSFNIDSGIEIPKRAMPSRRRSGSKYPFAQMEVNDSFLLPQTTKPTTIRSAIGAFSKRHADAGKFTVRATEEGLRVWRTE